MAKVSFRTKTGKLVSFATKAKKKIKSKIKKRRKTPKRKSNKRKTTKRTMPKGKRRAGKREGKAVKIAKRAGIGALVGLAAWAVSKLITKNIQGSDEISNTVSDIAASFQGPEGVLTTVGIRKLIPMVVSGNLGLGRSSQNNGIGDMV